MQTLTKLLIDQGLANRVLTESQLARVVKGSAPRRYNLVNRAMKAGDLHRIRRGLYVLDKNYRVFPCHPFAVTQRLVSGSYISLETALAYHGWIPEAVPTTASIHPGRKSYVFEDSVVGRLTFHPLAIQAGFFLELIERDTVDQQAMLIATPLRALMDLVCLRKFEWQGLRWLQKSMRIDEEQLASATLDQMHRLRLVYKHRRMQIYLLELGKALGLKDLENPQ